MARGHVYRRHLLYVPGEGIDQPAARGSTAAGAEHVWLRPQRRRGAGQAVPTQHDRDRQIHDCRARVMHRAVRHGACALPGPSVIPVAAAVCVSSAPPVE